MTAKKYIARDMGSALKKVREELGPDAIILSSKRADKGVEIVATLDTAPPSPETAAKTRFSQAFDDELDQPLASDTEWAEHHQASRIAANTHVAATASEAPRQAPPVAQARAPSARSGQSRANTPPASAAPLSANGAAAFSDSAAQNAERLAKEVQAAHERMLAAKAQGAGPAVSCSNQARPQHYAEAPYEEPANPEIPERAVNSSRESVARSGQNRQLAGFAEQARARGIDDHSGEDSARLHSLYDEIAEMRMLLEEQMWQQQQGPTAAPVKGLTGRAKQLAAQLAQLGLPDALLQELLICADDKERLPNCWRKALAMLVRRLPVNSDDMIEQGGRYAFVGPTGVGKTTTIAKLAARYVLNHGRGKVAIVTTDTYRVGAHDQLKALGRILQVPVRSVEGDHQLTAVLASLKQYPLVLIDTAGFRQGDPKLMLQESLISACPEVQRVLVLAANSQQQILKASIHAYSSAPLQGCIFTKLDECASLGEAFGALCSADVPLAYTAAGQEIPDDIHVVSASDLVAQAVKLARQHEGAQQWVKGA